MTKKHFAGLLSLFLLFHGRGYAQADSVKTKKQIVDLEQKLADALPVDSAFWSRYLDPGWHIVDEDGNSSSKTEFLASFKPFPATIRIHADVTKPVFTFHGNDVVVIQYTADEHETAYGQPLHTSYGTMDVWYRSDTSWLMLAMQNFEIPAWPPAIRVTTSVLKEYAGTYQLDEKNRAEVILKGDTLVIRKNKQQPVALQAETNNVFFRKSDARGRKIFVREDNGGMQLRERRNGQDLVWRRLH